MYNIIDCQHHPVWVVIRWKIDSQESGESINQPLGGAGVDCAFHLTSRNSVLVLGDPLVQRPGQTPAPPPSQTHTWLIRQTHRTHSEAKQEVKYVALPCSASKSSLAVDMYYCCLLYVPKAACRTIASPVNKSSQAARSISGSCSCMRAQAQRVFETCCGSNSWIRRWVWMETISTHAPPPR